LATSIDVHAARVALLTALLACSPGDEARLDAPDALDDSELLDGRSVPATAHPDVLRSLREAEDVGNSPSDGQGEATIGPSDPVVAGSPGAWIITYTAGPAGIDPGGSVVLQVSPFWGWSDPQTVAPEYPGYTRLETRAAGVRLDPTPCGAGCLRVGIEGAPLRSGEAVAIHYGAPGPGAAYADRYAESREEFFLRVDGDGDGTTAPLADPPVLEILPGPASSLLVVAQSTARVGEPIWINVAALDARWNAARDFTGEVEVIDAGGLEGLPERIRLGPDHRGSRRIEARATRKGRGRVALRVVGWDRVERSNPFEVSDGSDVPRVLWADLHGHSGLSDGTGTPQDYLHFARDVAALDVAALTDHDHWGLRFLDREPALWREIRAAVATFHEPGRFVCLLGYEWTSWIFGHRHVLYFADDGAVFGSTDPETDEPEELWAKLADQPPALTIAHHPAGGPVAVDWSIEPDPRFEPVVEISSVHGTSECAGCPATLRGAFEGSFVRDALARGYRLGLVGSGDTHDGHPGLGSPEDWVRGRTLGLAALLTDELNRASVLEALRARRVYATSGPRILLRFAVADARMGGVARIAEPSQPRAIYVRAGGTAAIERVEVVKNGEVAFEVAGDGREVVELLVEDASPAADGDYLYARVMQEDGGMAWSSPIWLSVDGAR
jgi:hypothetical protein